MPDEPAELLGSTAYLLARAGSESRRRFVEALAAHGLTLSAYSVLMVLGSLGGATQRDLATAVGVDPRNLVPILDDLESRGLIGRGSHPADRRRHAVRLSPGGKARLERLRATGVAAERAFLDPLSAAEKRELHTLLRKLLDL